MDENCNGNPPSVIVTGNDLDPGGNGMAASDPAAGLNGINLPTTVNIYFRLNTKPCGQKLTYSMVPNNSAARLLTFKIFSLPTRFIWTYTLIKIQIIILSTRLLSTIFYFSIYF